MAIQFSTMTHRNLRWYSAIEFNRCLKDWLDVSAKNFFNPCSSNCTFALKFSTICASTTGFDLRIGKTRAITSIYETKGEMPNTFKFLARF
jgi:hypothetical protein